MAVEWGGKSRDVFAQKTKDANKYLSSAWQSFTRFGNVILSPFGNHLSKKKSDEILENVVKKKKNKKINKTISQAVV